MRSASIEAKLNEFAEKISKAPTDPCPAMTQPDQQAEFLTNDKRNGRFASRRLLNFWVQKHFSSSLRIAKKKKKNFNFLFFFLNNNNYIKISLKYLINFWGLWYLFEGKVPWGCLCRCTFFHIMGEVFDNGVRCWREIEKKERKWVYRDI